jgi:hypothetical protein
MHGQRPAALVTVPRSGANRFRQDQRRGRGASREKESEQGKANCVQGEEPHYLVAVFYDSPNRRAATRQGTSHDVRTAEIADVIDSKGGLAVAMPGGATLLFWDVLAVNEADRLRTDRMNGTNYSRLGSEST